MREREIRAALTADSDFEPAGFRALLRESPIFSAIQPDLWL